MKVTVLSILFAVLLQNIPVVSSAAVVGLDEAEAENVGDDYYYDDQFHGVVGIEKEDADDGDSGIDLEEENSKDNANAKRCMNRCGRRFNRKTRSYSNCERQCRASHNPVGKNYCTDAPNYKCYKNGWPRCCLNNDGRNCPQQKPGCNLESIAAARF